MGTGRVRVMWGFGDVEEPSDIRAWRRGGDTVTWRGTYIWGLGDVGMLRSTVTWACGDMEGHSDMVT